MLNTQDRWRGFRDALKEAGIADNDIWTFTVTGMDNFEEPVRDAIGSLLRLPNPPTALIAGGYYLALAALQIAYDNNTRVPDQLSVIGFDDPPSASLSVPALTTLRQPLERMGAQAAEILMKLMRERPEKPPHIRVPLELIVRNSASNILNHSKIQEE
jgi:LacI family transcriptional regulator